MKIYNLFISHSWKYSDHYERLVSMLEAAPRFLYHNYSIPKDDPIHTNGTDKELRAAITRKMQPCSVVLILAGMYANPSRSIQMEIGIANHKFEKEKPIIAIEPRGSVRTSQVVKDVADKIVGWDTNSIVTAIRELARS